MGLPFPRSKASCSLLRSPSLFQQLIERIFTERCFLPVQRPLMSPDRKVRPFTHNPFFFLFLSSSSIPLLSEGNLLWKWSESSLFRLSRARQYPHIRPSIHADPGPDFSIFLSSPFSPSFLELLQQFTLRVIATSLPVHGEVVGRIL